MFRMKFFTGDTLFQIYSTEGLAHRKTTGRNANDKWPTKPTSEIFEGQYLFRMIRQIPISSFISTI